jgi:hypothetical protein
MPSDDFGVDLEKMRFRLAALIVEGSVPGADFPPKLLPGPGRRAVQHNTGVRADWALSGLRAFADTTGMGEEPFDSVVVEMLASLRHLCRFSGLDFDAIDGAAGRRFEEDVR